MIYLFSSTPFLWLAQQPAQRLLKALPPGGKRAGTYTAMFTVTNKLQTSANWRFRRITDIRRLKVISNTELWEATGQKRIILKLIMRKWRWVSHTVRKRGWMRWKKNVGWNQQGAGRRGRKKQNWKKVVLDEAGKRCKIWSEVKRLAGRSVGCRSFATALCS